MLKLTSQEFREIFLTKFTQELINTFAPKEIIKLETEIKEIKKDYNPPQIKKQIISPPRKRFQQSTRPIINPMRIKERRLPQRLQYLQPIPRETPMDLGKLNQILKNPRIKSIICNGLEQQIIINSPNPNKINLTLSKEEIENIINEFSKISKIPAQEGIYRVAAGRLILLAVISKLTDTKFIIKKILPHPLMMHR
ncbi:hypothetical protein HN832_04945 [archaeon]|jgi:hypothetical protein|nr:hypothetical protein [archaeon]MBT4374035.1 hypothetical protein [archaeon]MBT4532131.1 hypothetical protein [archaeon]MBT7002021.1 hypothetical protein [archaeon]MBT7282732.1 hypothetical protein [archaeon]